MFEHRAAVDTDTRDADNREFDDQHITGLAGWVVTGCTLYGAHCAVGKCLGVEAGSSLSVLIVPEANRVLCHCASFHLADCDDEHRTERAATSRGDCSSQLTISGKEVSTHLYSVHMAHRGLASRPGTFRKTAGPEPRRWIDDTKCIIRI